MYMPHTKRCKNCGIIFEPIVPFQAYHTILCQMEANAKKRKEKELSPKKPRKRKCRFCKEYFVPVNASQYYHNTDCQLASQKLSQKKKKEKDKKRNSVSFLKKKAWDIFSKYIRTRDCLASQGSREFGNCFTCNKVYPIGKLQAGHFVDGRMKPVLFNEDIVHSQCYGCNISKKGNKEEYIPKMIDIWGIEKTLSFLELRKSQDKIWSREELEKIIDDFSSKLENLER